MYLFKWLPFLCLSLSRAFLPLSQLCSYVSLICYCFGRTQRNIFFSLHRIKFDNNFHSFANLVKTFFTIKFCCYEVFLTDGVSQTLNRLVSLRVYQTSIKTKCMQIANFFAIGTEPLCMCVIAEFLVSFNFPVFIFFGCYLFIYIFGDKNESWSPELRKKRWFIAMSLKMRMLKEAIKIILFFWNQEAKAAIKK